MRNHVFSALGQVLSLSTRSQTVEKAQLLTRVWERAGEEAFAGKIVSVPCVVNRVADSALAGTLFRVLDLKVVKP